MPSPESPAKRITARSVTSCLCFDGGTFASVHILILNLRSSMGSPCSPGGVRLDQRMKRLSEQDSFQSMPPGADTKRLPYWRGRGGERVRRAALCLIRKVV